MKKIIMLLTAITLVACSEKSNNPYVTLEGNINNAELDSIVILGKNFKKSIKVNEDGSFKDTLKVVDGFHGISDGKQQGFLYLKNGYDMDMEIDMEHFPQSIVYEGEGSITNNYLGEKIQFIKDEKLTDYAAFFALEKDEFDSRLGDLKTNLDNFLKSTKGLDAEVIKIENESNDKLIKFFQSNYESEHANYVGLNAGDPSPKFNYPDQNGKNVSLDDLKGKYVYVDVWATWCGPCKKEIPFLKEMDEEYKGKNIAFVSMSIDDDRSHGGSWEKANEDWKKMVSEKELGGIQIFAPKGWQSEFVKDYKINGIPRFILVDPAGNIVSASAPRPSSEELIKLFDEENI